LNFNIYLIQAPGFVALIDAGVGDDKERPERPAWHRLRTGFLKRLSALGFLPRDIDVVVNTHLHADHVGWNTVRVGETWRPTFPRARYVVPAADYDYWRGLPAPKDDLLHGAFKDSILPLAEAGVLESVESSAEIVPGLCFEPAHGHSPGMCIVRLRTEDRSVLFTSDVLHHPFQFAAPEMVSNFCADPAAARATRKRVLDQNIGTNCIIAPYHFPSPAFGTIECDGHGFSFAPLAMRPPP
jgi:glyoxylase-like metal-dependent hydrolase (beta-lactamase superfamily II)